MDIATFIANQDPTSIPTQPEQLAKLQLEYNTLPAAGMDLSRDI